MPQTVTPAGTVVTLGTLAVSETGGSEAEERMEDEKGLLGSLPSHRPSVASPRRARAREEAASRQAADAETERSTADAPNDSPSGGVGAIEDLARTGVGLAVDATTVGLGLAGRALGGIGRVLGRR